MSTPANKDPHRGETVVYCDDSAQISGVVVATRLTSGRRTKVEWEGLGLSPQWELTDNLRTIAPN